MAFHLTCPECTEQFRDDTVEGVLKRAAAHAHDSHGGPSEITPELEAALTPHVKQV